MNPSNGRDIIVCLDGTTNTSQGYVTKRKPGPPHTNVYKLFSILQGTNQVRGYFPGVGTHVMLDKLPMITSGRGVRARLLWSYQWVVANHEPDDRIFIFGFSRGAYTARHLAGLITRAGLNRQNLHKTHDVIKHYTLKLLYEPPERGENATVQFLGMWDVVASTGLTICWHAQQHNGPLENGIRYAAHAVSLDERRLTFTPEIYDPSSSNPQFVQRFFRGTHSDVGGGNPDTRLSDAALDWMVQWARAADLTIPDLESALCELGIKFSPGVGIPRHKWLGISLRNRKRWLKKSGKRGYVEQTTGTPEL